MGEQKTGAAGSASMLSASERRDPFIPLIADFASYWKAPSPPYDGTAQGGVVLNPRLLARNDRVTLAINHAPDSRLLNSRGKGERQRRRALSDRDADRDVAFELKDGFGPLLGRFFREGYDNGDLDLVARVMNCNGWSGNPAKNVYQYPRPYVRRDVWLPDRQHLEDGHNTLSGLQPQLDIARVPDGLGEDGRTHSADYEKNAPQGAFPSGHTNKAYSRGIVLAVFIPRLAPEILARVAEAENNRIILGVHYALDVIGGRAGGLDSAASFACAHTVLFDEARTQLVDYLEKRCRDQHLGKTLGKAIHATGSDGKQGYANSFVDLVSPFPITDRASAVQSYRRRLVYGFSRFSCEDPIHSGGGQNGGDRTRRKYVETMRGDNTASGRQNSVCDDSWVPPLAPLLLRYAYPQLEERQWRMILAQTALPAGCPFEHSSHGWVRLDLTRALSQKVSLDSNGTVLSCVDWVAPTVGTR